MNTQSDMEIMAGVREHFEEAEQHFPLPNIVGIFLQGSQNYGLGYEGSDIDTKLIVTPTFQNIALNKPAVSTTHIRANEEHIDFKDIRLYMQTFRKQNLNFVEILFTDYKIINYRYEAFWQLLVDNRERIARYNPFRAVKTMKGIAMEKYHAMEHRYPSKVEVLDQYGYDPKQLHHLLRVEEFLGRYIAGEPYEDCLKPRRPDYLIDVKRGHYDLETARIVAKTAISNIERIADSFCERTEDVGDPYVDELLETVQYMIMKSSVERELK